MVIIQLDGGLGNQMFEYALYYSFLKKGINSKLDTSKFDEKNAHNGYELEKIFNINGIYCTKLEKKIIKPASKLLHIFFKHPYKEKKQWQWAYHDEASNIKFGFLKGYWQNEKYFKNIENDIRQKFKFPSLSDSKNIEILDKMKKTNSVSLHIRRGDYLLEGRGCSINITYYDKAISLINQRLTGPYFFIFSDDIEWAKDNIKEKNVTFIDWNNNDRSFIDMQLMSLCKHNIIANSSFSWWGAWLNANPSKIVIAPMQWMPHIEEARDLIPNDWVKLSVEY
jgi:hypothetical protein